jgi:hypothetical protein
MEFAVRRAWKAFLGLLHHLIRVVRFLAPHLIYGFVFMSIGVYAAHSWQLVEQAELAAGVEKEKYAAQRTNDMVALMKSSGKPVQDFGCPVEELHTLPKKGKKTKKVC